MIFFLLMTKPNGIFAEQHIAALLHTSAADFMRNLIAIQAGDTQEQRDTAAGKRDKAHDRTGE